MTLDLAKLRAETLALLSGTTPGTACTHCYGRSANDRCLNCGAYLPAPTLAADNLRLLDEIERLRAENETAVRRSAEWMRNRIAELARQTAANIIAESAGGPRHRRGYEAGRAAAFEIMARTILAVPLPANGAALAEGGPDDR